jgi:hypothetical protein
MAPRDFCNENWNSFHYTEFFSRVFERKHSRRKIMRFATLAFMATTGVAGMIGSALAADLTGDEIKALISGKTAYIQTTSASSSGQAGQAVIYWAENGTALFKTPNGTIIHGKWQIKGNTNCPEWKERPGTACVRYDKTGDVVTAVDATSGQPRAKYLKIVPGNAEKLAP